MSAGNRTKRIQLAGQPDRVKRLHVDQSRIRGGTEPPLTVQTSAGSLKAFKVRIEGPSEMVYQPNDPLSCGARLWIETNAPVTADWE